ncbi:MAG: hypothetical protein RJS97_02965, partial [Parvibaculaceae bacterium]
MINISCVGGHYKAEVQNAGDCINGGSVVATLFGQCDECSGLIGWTQDISDDCICCGCDPSEATGMTAEITASEPSTYPVVLMPVPECNPYKPSNCCTS